MAQLFFKTDYLFNFFRDYVTCHSEHGRSKNNLFACPLHLWWWFQGSTISPQVEHQMPLTTEQSHRHSHRGVAGFLGIQFRPWSLPSKHFIYRDVSPAVPIECLRNINIFPSLVKCYESYNIVCYNVWHTETQRTILQEN